MLQMKGQLLDHKYKRLARHGPVIDRSSRFLQECQFLLFWMLIMITLIELTLEIEVLLKTKQLQSQEFDRDLNKILQRQSKENIFS